jgi:hypothetical protein
LQLLIQPLVQGLIAGENDQLAQLLTASHSRWVNIFKL